jgi:hypothetical protein
MFLHPLIVNVALQFAIGLESVGLREPIEVIKWNNRMREMTLGDLPDGPQAYMEGYVEEFVPPGKVVYRWFDVYDYEEKRL